MTVAEKTIELAKKEDWALHVTRRDARNERKRLLREGKTLSLKEAYQQAVEINEPLRQNEEHGTALLTVNVPYLFRDLADALVLAGIFPNRGEIVRTALREYLKGWIDLTEFNEER